MPSVRQSLLSHTRASRRVASARPRLELLESRLAPAIFTVTDGGDSGPGTLRDAILQANAFGESDTIEFDSSVTTVTLLSTLPKIQGELAIVGASSRTLITGDSGGFGFTYFDGDTDPLSLYNLHITNARGISGAVFSAGFLLLDNCYLDSNSIGGAVVVQGANLTIRDSYLRNNSSASLASAVYAYNSNCFFYSSTFEGNIASEATVRVESDAASEFGNSVLIQSCTFSGNMSALGSILSFNNVQGILHVTLNHNTFTGYASMPEGAVSAHANSGFISVSVRNTIFADTSAAQTFSLSAEGDGTTNFFSLGGNLSGTSESLLDQPGDRTSAFAGLLALADNGGPAPTHMLRPDSDALNNAITDEAGSPADPRGVVRDGTYGDPDIGAIEARGYSFSASSPGGPYTAGERTTQTATATFSEGGDVPLVGLPVVFTLSAGSFDGGVTETTVLTDASGTATALPITAPTNAGNFNITASAVNTAGLSEVMTASSLAGTFHHFVLVSPTTTSPGVEFEFVVRPEDQHGNASFNKGLDVVRIESSDPGFAGPSSVTIFNGETPEVFLGLFTLTRSGTQTITIIDDATSAVLDTLMVEVDNLAPSFASLSRSESPITEGQEFHWTGSIEDIGGAGQTHQVIIDWGDGTTDVYDLAAGVSEFDFTHRYIGPFFPGDGDLTGVFSSITIVDEQGARADWSEFIVIQNVAPVVTFSSMEPVGLTAGQTLSFGGSFTDPETGPWTATVDHGDGDGPQPLDLTTATEGGTFDLSHQYTLAGSYTLTVTVTDSRGLSHSATREVVVTAGVGVTYNIQAPESVNPGDVFSVSVRPLDAFGNATSNYPHTLTVVSSDPNFVGPGTLTLDPDTGEFSLSDLVLNNSGSQTISLVSGETTLATFSVVVTNNVPHVLQFSHPGLTSEGADFTFDGIFQDIGGDLQDHELLITWGDGSSSVVSLPTGATTFSATHRFVGPFPNIDGAIGTTVTFSLSDGVSEPGSFTFFVHIQNVAPTVTFNQPGPISVKAGQTLNLGGSFTDPETGPWTALVDHGDGSGFQPLTLTSGEEGGTFAFAHQYTLAGTHTVTVIVTDDRGLSQTATLQVNVVAGPALTYEVTSPAEVNPGDVFGISVRPLDAFGNETSNYPHTLTLVSSDPNFVGPGTLTLDPDTGAFSLSDLVLNNSGSQTISLVSGETTLATFSVVVTNNVPSVLQFSYPGLISEGADFTFDGIFQDIGGDLQDHELQITWGDGSSSVVSLPTGATTFSATHRFVGPFPNIDGAIGTTVTFSLSDGVSEPGSFTFFVHIQNVAPTVTFNQPGPISVKAGQTLNLGGSFADPESGPWTALVDHGDGSGFQPLTLTSGEEGGTFAFAHQYTLAGTHTVTVIVTDDRGLSQTATLQVNVVAGPAVTYEVTSPAEVNPGDTFGVSVRPLDEFGNETSTYPHTLTVASSDPDFVGPTSLIVPPDAGTFAISDLVLHTTGTQSISLRNGAAELVSFTVPVANADPSNLVLSHPPTVSEGQTFTLEGTFADQGGAFQTHTVTIEWGDGTTEILSLDAGETSFSRTHRYVGPIAESEGEPGTMIRVTVVDSLNASATNLSFIVIQNVAPVLNFPQGPIPLTAGDSLNLAGSFLDPEAGPWSVEIRYGDGATESQTIPSNLSQGAVIGLSHRYTLAGTHTVSVNVTDGRGATGTATFDVVVAAGQATTYQILHPNEVNPGETFAISVRPLDAFGNETSNYPHTLTVVSSDPGFADRLVSLAPDTGAFSVSDLALPTTGSQTITLQHSEQSLTTFTVEVRNAAPQLGPITLPTSVAEGEIFTLDGLFEDLGGLQQAHEVCILWGDGSTGLLALAPGQTSFSLTHRFLGSLELGQPQVRVCVTDSEGARDEAIATLTLNNVAPVVVLSNEGPLALTAGQTLNLNGLFSDPEAGPWTATVDYGNGAGFQPLTLSETAEGATFALSQRYTQAGMHSIVVRVTDSRGLVGSRTLVVEVTAGPVVAYPITAPEVTQGVGFALLVRPVDAFGNLRPSGVGTVLITTSDPTSTGPTSFTFSGDQDEYQIPGLILNRAGTHTIRLLDPQTQAILGDVSVLVPNEAPSNILLSLPDSVAEGERFLLTGSFIDPGNLERHRVTIVWADGQTETIDLLPGVKSFQSDHVFLGPFQDNNGVANIQVTVTDADSDTTTSVPVVVLNLAPDVDVEGDERDQLTNIGARFRRDGFFHDTDTGPFRIEVDYGDNSGIQTLSHSETLEFTLSHVYRAEGSFTVQVRVVDNRGGVGQTTFVVDVLLPGVDTKKKEFVSPGDSDSISVPGMTVTLDNVDEDGRTASIVVAVVPRSVVDRLGGFMLDVENSIQFGYDIRTSNIGPEDSARVVFYGIQGPPVLTYFNPITRRQELVQSSVLVYNPGLRTLTLLLDWQSFPKLEHLHGTVFTITVPLTLPDGGGGSGPVFPIPVPLPAPAFQPGVLPAPLELGSLVGVGISATMTATLRSEVSFFSEVGTGGGASELHYGFTENHPLSHLPPKPQALVPFASVTLAPSAPDVPDMDRPLPQSANSVPGVPDVTTRQTPPPEEVGPDESDSEETSVMIFLPAVALLVGEWRQKRRG